MLAAYFDNLLSRRDEAAEIRRGVVSFRDGSLPKANCCHDNVDRWIAECPDFAAVRGWVIITEASTSALLAAHSVVRDPQGGWLDITPQPDGYRTLFIQHIGTREEFDLMRLDNASLWWPAVAVDRIAVEPGTAFL